MVSNGLQLGDQQVLQRLMLDHTSGSVLLAIADEFHRRSQVAECHEATRNQAKDWARVARLLELAADFEVTQV